jgi:hypothetical protein
MAIKLDRTEADLIHQRSGVAFDPACSGHVGVVSQDQMPSRVDGLV